MAGFQALQVHNTLNHLVRGWGPFTAEYAAYPIYSVGSFPFFKESDHNVFQSLLISLPPFTVL
jgi:hypothetical protein